MEIMPSIVTDIVAETDNHILFKKYLLRNDYKSLVMWLLTMHNHLQLLQFL